MKEVEDNTVGDFGLESCRRYAAYRPDITEQVLEIARGSHNKVGRCRLIASSPDLKARLLFSA